MISCHFVTLQDRLLLYDQVRITTFYEGPRSQFVRCICKFISSQQNVICNAIIILICIC